MATQERTGRLPLVRFAQHEARITKGEVETLRGWWAAADEAIKRHGNVYGTPSKYAREASKVATRNTETTIRQFVSAIIVLIDHGHTLDEFVKQGMGIEHARAHAKSYSTKSVRESEPLTAKQELRKFLAGKSKAQLEFIVAEANRQLRGK